VGVEKVQPHEVFLPGEHPIASCSSLASAKQ
jgi:hypothetical protein